ncbi:alcohol dehydrogenase catalytic domain-containing protein [Dyadobacter bucti]|uniref:alcohol dehydrogenase catalytic domain-containing protein n=1 Tax=Dyadobacter bucti TaxID=2572203 RepID=UPI003F70F5E1
MDLPDTMHAMVLEKAGEPLLYKTVPVPQPGENQVLIKVHACGVCRTNLHIVDGELKNAKLPLIPGHEIVGTVVKVGVNTNALQPGMLVGVPWLGYSCGQCVYCRTGRENLCDAPLFTGYTIDGGYKCSLQQDQCYLVR